MTTLKGIRAVAAAGAMHFNQAMRFTKAALLFMSSFPVPNG